MAQKVSKRRVSIKVIAARFDGRSQRCSKCSKNTYLCINNGQFYICHENFIEGFLKGVKYIKSQLKNK